MPAPVDTMPAPADFVAGLTALRETVLRDEVLLREVPGPARLAPWSAAFTAEAVTGSLGGDGVVAHGRLVILHDPAEPEAWQGATRIVAYAQGAVEPEMAADPLLLAVGWSWLLESLAAYGAEHQAAGGTVTRTSSARFGGLADDPEDNEIEVRASWTPTGGPLAQTLPAHLRGWADLLCSTAGLPPPGITSLRRSADPRG